MTEVGVAGTECGGRWFEPIPIYSGSASMSGAKTLPGVKLVGVNMPETSTKTISSIVTLTCCPTDQEHSICPAKPAFTPALRSIRKNSTKYVKSIDERGFSRIYVPFIVQQSSISRPHLHREITLNQKRNPAQTNTLWVVQTQLACDPTPDSHFVTLPCSCSRDTSLRN